MIDKVLFVDLDNVKGGMKMTMLSFLSFKSRKNFISCKSYYLIIKIDKIVNNLFLQKKMSRKLI